MLSYFYVDRDISFDQLIDGRLKPYGIEVHIDPEISGRPTASLICDGSKLLVRTNDKGMVSRLIPIEIDAQQIRYMLDAIGYEFNAVFHIGYDGPYKYIREDVEAPD